MALRDKLGEMRYGQMSEDGDRYQMGAVGVDPFLSEVEELKGWINQVEEDLLFMRQIHSELLTRAISPDSQRKSLEEKRKNVSALSIRVHAGIERLKGRVTSEAGQTAEHRIRKAQLAALVKKFHSAMEAFNEEQEMFKKKSKDKISRQLKILGKNKSDQEIQDMIESHDPNVFSNEVMTQKMLSRDALNEIEQRHHDILELEKDILELQEIFRDLAILVDEQGDVIDNIEAHMEAAVHHVHKGEENIVIAKRYKQSSRRKLVIIIVIIVGVVAAIIVAVVVAIGVAVAIASN